ncbi:MAG: DUF368 domain-containing protein [Desulfobacter sp.]
MNTVQVKISTVKALFIGFCLGVANIIPGVSGGTFLLVFGIYERVFAIVNQINKAFLTRLAALGLSTLNIFGRPRQRSELIAFLRDTGFSFLFILALGAVVAILALSGMMKYLLLHHFSVTYALFFGLILVSVVIPAKMIKTFNPGTVFFIFLGMALTVGVTWMVNPYDKIKLKSDALEPQYLASSGHGDTGVAAGTSGDGKKTFGFTGRYAPDEYLYIGICGALAISATVLPGISGSLVLILMGTYFDVISAISALKTLNLDTFFFLGCFGLGVLIGGVLFAKLVSFVLDRYYTATMSFLIGLMVGSLYALWPFKQTIVMARQYIRQDERVMLLENVAVQTNINVMPGSDAPIVAAFLFFVLGCIIMAGFIRAESPKAV